MTWGRPSELEPVCWLPCPLMTWEDVLHDVEAQAAGVERLDMDVSAAAIAQAEHARTTLTGRWHDGRGRRVEVRLLGGHTVAGTITPGGPDMLLLAGPATLLRPDSVMAVVGSLRRSTGAASGPVSGDADVADVTGLRLAAALRIWSRHRRLVSLGRVDGSVRSGTVVAVGADHCDLVPHDWTTPLAEAGTTAEITPFSAVAYVRVEL